MQSPKGSVCMHAKRHYWSAAGAITRCYLKRTQILQTHGGTWVDDSKGSKRVVSGIAQVFVTDNLRSQKAQQEKESLHEIRASSTLYANSHIDSIQ